MNSLNISIKCDDDMIKTVEIVSLSSGILGESFVSHELNIGVERLKAMGLAVKFSEHDFLCDRRR